MSSLYLGQISTENATYQIHAFTNGLPFRELPTSQISDPALFEAMLKGRYQVLASGRELLWGGIDKEKQIEHNPHDDRPGSFHIAALDQKDERMVCVVSVAVDTGEKEHGELIGLPLENRWRKNEILRSPSLDPFRERYFDLNYDIKKPVGPYQMAELYRHFRVSDIDANVPRMGISIGAYHLLVTEARARNQVDTFLWVFYAIVPYFNLYRMVGAAVLRDFTIKSPPRYISPNPEKITYKQKEYKTYAYWGNEIISTSVKNPKLYIQDGEIKYKMEDVIFLDGLVDLHKVERAILESPIELLPLQYEGMTEEDMQMVRAGVSIVGKRGYEEHHKNNARVISTINQYSRGLGIKFKFNDIGGLQA